MAQISGRRRALPLSRRWIDDLMRVSRGRPLVTFERRMNLGSLAPLRKQRDISWPVLFVKAYGMASARRPELRRALMPFPWPHLYESDHTHLTFALEREYEGEPAVFFGTYYNPHTQALADLQSYLQHWRTAPVESVPEFARMISYTKWPWWVRRFVWRYGADFTGGLRVRNFGTCGISVTASAGATAMNLLAPVTSTLNYGPFDAAHNLDVRLHFDHRVLDGMAAARILAEIEEHLHGPIAEELRGQSRETFTAPHSQLEMPSAPSPTLPAPP